VAFASLAGERQAAAESTLVVVGQRKPSAPEADRLVYRLRGELAADGIDVNPGEVPIAATGVDSLAQEARDAGAAVGAALVVGNDGRTIELTLVDPSTARVFRRQLDLDTGTEPSATEVLARRSVDLLRASLLDFMVESLRVAIARSPPTANHRAPAEAPAPSRGLRMNLGGGVGLLTSFRGVGPALLPVVRAGVASEAADAHWQLRATAAWLGTRPVVTTPTGSATIDQGVAVIETALSPWTGRTFEPLASLGLGVYYAGAHGVGEPPYRGRQDSSFALALSTGIGAVVRAASAIDVAIDVQAFVTAPGLAVRFLDEDAARIGRPSVLASITVAGRL
jgi:hypothetical protein